MVEFTCKSCNFIERYEDFHSPNKCPKCECKWYILRWPEEDEIKRTIDCGENCRYSVTLGVPETQIEEAKKLHPQAEWKKFGHSYRPLIKNRADKKRLMKQAGFEEYDPKYFKGRQK